MVDLNLERENWDLVSESHKGSGYFDNDKDLEFARAYVELVQEFAAQNDLTIKQLLEDF